MSGALDALLVPPQGWNNATSTAVDTQIVFLCHFDGTNGSSTFTDSSSYGHTISRDSTPTISTTQSKFGGASGVFSGSLQEVKCAASADFSLSGDFTIRGWVYFNTVSSDQYLFGFQQAVFNGLNSIWIWLDGATHKLHAYTFGADINGLNALSINTWYYVGLNRTGTTCEFRIDGVQQGTRTSSSTPGTSRISFGGSDGLSSNTQYLNGYMDDWEIINGTAADITTIPTQAFANPTHTIPTPVLGGGVVFPTKGGLLYSYTSFTISSAKLSFLPEGTVTVQANAGAFNIPAYIHNTTNIFDWFSPDNTDHTGTPGSGYWIKVIDKYNALSSAPTTWTSLSSTVDIILNAPNPLLYPTQAAIFDIQIASDSLGNNIVCNSTNWKFQASANNTPIT